MLTAIFLTREPVASYNYQYSCPEADVAENQKFQGFFSYTHLDAEIDPDLVAALTTRLAQRVTRKITNAQLAIWRDVKNLRTGQRWDDRIGKAVRDSQVFIVLMTPKWFESANCRKEYQIFRQVEDAIGVGEYVVPILAHNVESQLDYFDLEQRTTYDELNKRQYKKAVAANFLALTTDQQEVIIDEIADDIERMIDRLRRKTLRAPQIPAQGYGPHFEIGDDGRVTFAPPDALDRQGNHIALLKKLHPTLCALASNLVNVLETGNKAHHLLGSRVAEYLKLVDQDLDHVDFTLLYVEGVHLANADKEAIATIADADWGLPAFPSTVRADMDTLLQVHGTFIMATAAGIEAVEKWHRYRPALDQVEFKQAADGFVKGMENHPAAIDPKVAGFARNVVNEIGTGSEPNRSSAVAAGAVTNLVITVVGAATLGALAAEAAASQSPALIGGAAATLLVVGEGLKKSKPFAIVADLVTNGFDKASETEVTMAYKDVSERLVLQVKFALAARLWLRRLAYQRESGLNWAISSLDWLKQPIATQSPSRSGRSGRSILFTPKMIRVPLGNLPWTFMMGSLPSEGRHSEEAPRREITIRSALEVGIFPVTRGEFRAFIDATSHQINEGAHVWTGEKWEFDESKSWWDPGFPQEDDHPAVCVNWHDAQSYLKWLNRRSGERRYRLLSEAEWEFCCRVGKTGPYSTGEAITHAQANFGRNAKGTTSVTSFPPNPWGLHDMHGNVWEWCEDNWHVDYSGNPPSDGSVWKGGDPSLQVQRGGSWYDDPSYLRSANRSCDRPGTRGDNVGFRIARTL